MQLKRNIGVVGSATALKECLKIERQCLSFKQLPKDSTHRFNRDGENLRSVLLAVFVGVRDEFDQ